MKIISGSSNPQLAENIAKKLNVPLINREITQFSNGEKRVWIKDKLHGNNVCLVQSITDPTDKTLMETLLIADALERMGVNDLILVLPWMGYSLQDKIFRNGEPISAKVVADLISNSYVKRVMLMDLHNNSIQAFFSTPTNYLSAMPLFEKYVKEKYDLDTAVVASPDFGGLKRARKFAKALDLDLVNIDKTRDIKTGKVNAIDLHGDVSQKTVFLFDDVILSGGTVVEGSALVKEKGAKKVIFLSTHGLFTNQAKQKIADSETDLTVVTNSIDNPDLSDKFKVLDVSGIFSQALERWL
ncbi:MAG: ribose-phosphate pyrophosphokinase [Patescibacteria group bacterium]|nr:ribose-phosphate pyrophosphokinase [Patescibacteria group bacterium]